MKKQFTCTIALTAFFLLSACHLAWTTPGTTGDLPAAEQTAVALAVHQTQTAAGSHLGSVEETVIPPAGSSPVSPAPMVSVSVATNCRTGPGEPYEIVGVLAVGQEAEVIGRNQTGDTWIIKLPSNPSIICWLWGYHATLVGETSGLTVYTPPPTPTPAGGFSLTYSYMVICGGNYAFRFQLTNTGTTTWKSYGSEVTDAVTSESRYYSDDWFNDVSPTCFGIGQLADLTPGETGAVGFWDMYTFDYDPSGHSMTATFRLCSEDGMGGMCVERSVSFTP